MWTCSRCNQKFKNSGQVHSCNDRSLNDFLAGKSEKTLALFNYFIDEYRKIGDFVLHPAKSRIGFAAKIRFGYIHRLGKDYIDIVFQFRQAHPENFCFHKIVNVPGSNIYNHYVRLYRIEDLTDEVKMYMRKALESGS